MRIEKESNMCKFFSFVTEPENNGGKRFYFDWDYRKEHLDGGSVDAHSSVCKHFKLNEDICNKYEFNPLTKELVVDQINSTIDDRIQVEEWVNKLGFKKIVKPLIITSIINPLELKMVKKPTKKQIALLKDWASVRASVREYCSSFFEIQYNLDFSSCVKLCEQGLVPSFDGTTWRLHSGKKAKVVYELKKEQE
jgi:hypothetical protein